MNRMFLRDIVAEARGAMALLTVAALLGLSACAPTPMTADATRVSLTGPDEALMIGEPAYAPSLTLIGQPGRRLLPNETALPGENFISTQRSGGFAGFGLEGVLRQAGPLPTPFEYAIARDFAPLPGGAYNFVARSPEPGITCVLVIGAGGAFTGGYTTMMRNCVEGDLSRAIAPLFSAV
jgi:hypothetical protein